MTFDEFFAELKKLRLRWFLQRDRQIRCRRRGKIFGTYTVCCPLTSLTSTSANEWKKAAYLLGISEPLANQIVHAADWGQGHGMENTEMYKYRRKLLTLVRASARRAKAGA